jgi:uncharacterized damage-inducible protein DinB
VTKAAWLLLAILSAVPVFAQEPAAAPTANPMSDSQKRIYGLLSGVVIAAAEKVPEESYAFKPTPEVRSFGQLIGHIANSQYFFCALAAGEPKPPSDVEKTKTSKADLIAGLKEAVAYCSTKYADMTDTKGAETVKFMNMDMARLTLLAANFAHVYEHYGNMVTYMRIRGIVPPTSTPRPQTPPAKPAEK